MNDPKDKNSLKDLNRRDFLKSTSTVVGGALLSSLSIERSAYAAGDDTIKLALIGCGGRGSGAANQALSTEGNVKLIAMADAFPDRLEGSLNNLSAEKKEKVDVPKDRQFIGLDAYKQAIALADVVILATPPGFRPIHFEEAVRQGKNIFMEKPVASDGPGIRRVLAAAEEAKKKNLKVAVGLQRHHQAGYIETIKRLQDGAIGDIVSMRCYWNDNGVWVRPRKPGQSEMEYQVMNWYYFTWLSGDHICEQHIHNLDVINWVKNGYPTKCRGMGGRQVRVGKEYGQIFDHHAVEYEYADGSRLASQCRHMPGCWSSVSEHVVGTKGKCEVNRYLIDYGTSDWRFKAKEKNPYQQEHDDLFDAIRNNKPYNEAERGAKSTLTAIMGRMSTYSGKEITWEEALNSKVELLPKIFAWDAPAPVEPNADGFYPVPIPGNPEWLKKIV